MRKERLPMMHNHMRSGQRLIRYTLIATLFGLMYTSLSATAHAAEQRRDSRGGSARETAPAGPDTSVMTGSGLNNLGGPIFRKAAEGTFRKDPGSRSWTKMELVTREQMREQRQQLHLQRLAHEGNKPLDIVVEVRDTTERASLRKLGITLEQAPPCTASVRILYRQLDSLKQRGTIFWFPGQRRPGSAPEPGKSLDRGAPTPSPRPLQPSQSGGGVGISSVTIWSDNFETYAVPGTNWTSYDIDASGGSDAWGRNTTLCGYVFGGSYSVHCAYNGDEPCYQYAPSQLAEMDQVPTLNISGYPSVAVHVNANYAINDGTYDVFNVWFDTGFGFALYDTRYGSSAGWIPLAYFFSGYSSLRIAFEFLSDDIYQIGHGVYLDNVTVVGTQPNLTYYTPSGWAGPIVPSSVTGTTSVGTLYAGEPVYLDWAILNNGDANTSNTFYVDFLVYDTNGTTLLVHDYRPVFGLAQGAAYPRQDDLTFTVNSAGTHKVRMVVDTIPSSLVAESNESPADNGVTRTYTWVTRPDLVVDNVTVTPPNPLVGQTVDIAVTIRNTGTQNIIATFNTDIYDNPGSPPSPPCPGAGNATNQTFGLNGNTSTTFHFYRTSTVAATWSTYLYVDRGCIATESNEYNNRYGPITIPWTAGNIAISGRFVYDDPLGTLNQPVRCMRVQIYDHDPTDPRDFLTETYTNEQGYFGPVNLVNQDTNYDQGALDIFVEGIYETSPSCRATSAVTVVGSSGTWWFYDTARRDNITNGDFGTIKPTATDHRSALHIYNTILRGYDWVTSRGNAMPHVQVEWFVGNPEHTAYDTLPAMITVSAQYAQPYADAPDELDDGVLLHEYGHHVAYTLSSMRATACTGTVFLSLPLPIDCAWNEGYADYFATLTTHNSPVSLWRNRGQESADPADTTVLRVDLETGVVVEADGFSYSVNENGEQYLVSVAATLWDVYDSVNDNPDGDGCSDQMADGVQSSWNLIADHPGVPMQTLCDFWYEFWRRYHQPGLAGPLNSTFCEHGVVCSGLVAVELIGPEPGKLLLEGCHPNPFRGSTRLFFSVPRLPGRVRLHVFDAAGHVVKSLVDGEMSPGRYAVSWDGRDDQDNPIAPNVYFVRLASMAGTRTSKVVFLR